MEQNIKTHILGNIAPKRELKKVFKGKTEFTLDYSTHESLAASRADRHFHQRMLRAYLKGKETFNFGFRYTISGHREQISHPVLFGWE